MNKLNNGNLLIIILAVTANLLYLDKFLCNIQEAFGLSHIVCQRIAFDDSNASKKTIKLDGDLK